MADLYEVLQIPPTASPDEIAEAQRRLLEIHGTDFSEEARALRREINLAYERLSDPERRAAYDREREAGSEVKPPVAPSPAAPSAGQNRTAALAIGLGAIALAILAVGVIALVLLARDATDRYPTKLGDEEYNLEAMALADDDLPLGIQRVNERAFDNKEWASVFDPDNLDLKVNQLDAQGRLRNFVAFYSWDEPVQHLGTVISITSQSTLYVDESSAIAAIRKYACGLLIPDNEDTDEFQVPAIGDQTYGFFVTQQQENFGKSVDTAVCFRTGRVVHAVMQTGLDGTQDIALGVKLAKRMLAHIEAVFDGKSPADASPTAKKG